MHCTMTVVNSQMKLYVNYTFDLETSNTQGQGHRQRSPMERTHQGLSTSDMWKSHWPWSRYNEFKYQLHIWPWHLEPSKSRSQTKVPMERTHQGLCTSEVWKSLLTMVNNVGTMKLNANHTFDLGNIQSQGHRQRVIDHGLGTMKLKRQ